MLSNAYFLAKFRFDTAENEPAKNLQNFRKMHFRKIHFSKKHFSKNAFFENAFFEKARGGGTADASAAKALYLQRPGSSSRRPRRIEIGALLLYFSQEGVNHKLETVLRCTTKILLRSSALKLQNRLRYRREWTFQSLGYRYTS